MPQKSKDILSAAMFGAVALAVTFGAAQLAPAHDLTGIAQPASGTPEPAINRAAKTDRAGVVTVRAPTRTISLRLDGLADTSILVRIPLVNEARSVSPSVVKSGNHKIVVACEPVVSVLTEIARQLQPGRCVT